MKALANAIGLRMLNFGFSVVNIIDGPEQLEAMLIGPLAIFGWAISLAGCGDTPPWTRIKLLPAAASQGFGSVDGHAASPRVDRAGG